MGSLSGSCRSSKLSLGIHTISAHSSLAPLFVVSDDDVSSPYTILQKVEPAKKTP